MADCLNGQHVLFNTTEIHFQFIFNKTMFHEHIEVLNVTLSPLDQWEMSHD